MGGRRCARWSGVKGRKWDKYNSIINRIYLKKKLSKQPEQEQDHRNGAHMEGYQQGSGSGRGGERYRE